MRILQKRFIPLIGTIGIVVLLAVSAFAVYQHNKTPCETAMSGGCLPEGLCHAPNDALVSCEELRANPNKSDWEIVNR